MTPHASPPILILVGGAPGTGKTTCATHLATLLDLPTLMLDDIKERLYDHVGWVTPAINDAAYAILFDTIEHLLRAGVSVVVDATFAPEIDTDCFLDMQTQTDFYPVQVMCHTAHDVLLVRLRQRTRHPGHMEGSSLKRIKQMIDEAHGARPLALGGPVYHVDTTEAAEGQYAAIADDLSTA